LNDEETKATEIKTSAAIDATEQDTSITMSKREYDELLHWADMGQQQTSFWDEALKNPEGTTALKDGIKDVVDSTLSSWAKLQKDQLKYSYIRVSIVVLLLGVIIGAASWLTSIGRLDGSGLIFLLGTITGYLLTFLAKMESV
jgi:Na+-transporting NADH:ubiquinone oxidoreductase subunit NqrB